MVVLVALFEAAQDCDSACLIGLVDHYLLEASLEGLVFLEILLILVKSGSADTSELATRECRFEDVCRIHGTFAFAGSDKCVDFVDEKDDFAVGRCHFIDNRLQAFLKLSLVLGSGHQRTHIQRINLLGAQVLGHVASDYTVREALGNGRLACARFADKHRIVLGASAQNLKHTANFLVAANHWVKLACTGSLIKINGIFGERIVGLLCALVGSLTALPQLSNSGIQLLAAQTGILQNCRRRRVYLKYCHEDCLQSYVLIAQLFGNVESLLKHIVRRPAKIRLLPRDFRERSNLDVDLTAD